jgi:hypothetical protein
MGPHSSTTVDKPDIDVGETTIVRVGLNNVPIEGYSSAEFTCAYDPNMLEVNNIMTTDLFGADSAVALNGPQDGTFIVAIAGSHGNKATMDGTAFTFEIKGLQAGQTTIDCKVRVNTGNNVPTTLFPSLALSPDGASLVVRDDIQNGRLWIKRRGELRAVAVPGTERSNHPVFSPDGEWVAFIADGRLRKVRPGEGAAITLADSAAGPFGGATWLDDGTLIYVGPTLSDLSRVSAAGGASARVPLDSSLAGLGISAPRRCRAPGVCCLRSAPPGV